MNNHRAEIKDFVRIVTSSWDCDLAAEAKDLAKVKCNEIWQTLHSYGGTAQMSHLIQAFSSGDFQHVLVSDAVDEVIFFTYALELVLDFAEAAFGKALPDGLAFAEPAYKLVVNFHDALKLCKAPAKEPQATLKQWIALLNTERDLTKDALTVVCPSEASFKAFVENLAHGGLLIGCVAKFVHDTFSSKKHTPAFIKQLEEVQLLLPSCCRNILACVKTNEKMINACERLGKGGIIGLIELAGLLQDIAEHLGADRPVGIQNDAKVIEDSTQKLTLAFEAGYQETYAKAVVGKAISMYEKYCPILSAIETWNFDSCKWLSEKEAIAAGKLDIKTIEFVIAELGSAMSILTPLRDRLQFDEEKRGQVEAVVSSYKASFTKIEQLPTIVGCMCMVDALMKPEAPTKMKEYKGAIYYVTNTIKLSKSSLPKTVLLKMAEFENRDGSIGLAKTTEVDEGTSSKPTSEDSSGTLVKKRKRATLG